MRKLNARAQRSSGARPAAAPLIVYPLSTLNPQPSTLVRDWPQLAHQAGYSVSALAEACGVSVRTLERFFLAALGDTPRRWLKRLRMQRAIELLRDGSNISEAAFCLGYEDPSHFSREFKKCYGFPPNKNANPPAKTAATPQMAHSAIGLSRLAMK
jgi:AraC-like DNA-binding protein